MSAPFSIVVREQSMPDRHHVDQDGRYHLLPRKTLHHVHLQDVATGQLAPLAVAATETIAKAIATEVECGRLPAVLYVHDDSRYAVWTDPVFPCPEATFPAASGSPLAPVLYEWSPPDRYRTGEDGQPVRLPPQTLHNVWVSDHDEKLCGFLCTAATSAVAAGIAASLTNCSLPVALRGDRQLCYAVWTTPLSTSPIARPVLGSC